jgi:hypothetical protein
MSKETLEALKGASRGLLFPSETDSPFEPFVWEGEEGKPDKAGVLERAGKPPRTPVKVMSLDAFFRDVTTDENWHDAEEKEEVRKFRQLVQTLKKALKDIKVFKLGKVESDVYIVGRTESGDWAGLKTKVVET